MREGSSRMLAASVPRWWWMLMRKRPRFSRMKLEIHRFPLLQFLQLRKAPAAAAPARRTSSASSGRAGTRRQAPVMRSIGGAPTISSTSRCAAAGRRVAATDRATRWLRHPRAGASSGWAPRGSIPRQSSKVRYRTRSCATMPSSKLLIFSDIHNDWKTLERLSQRGGRLLLRRRRPGDLVERPRTLRRDSADARRQGLRPARQPRVRRPDRRACARDTASTISTNGTCTSGAGTSPASAIPAPLPSTRPANTREPQLAERLAAFRRTRPLVLICHAPPYGTALDASAPACTPAPPRSAISSNAASPLTSSAATSTKPKAWRSKSAKRARAMSAKKAIC